MWKHFKKWGDVREVFISKQRNRNGRRFGSARFKGVEDERMLEKKLDSIIVEGLKLYVNLPRYGRLRGAQPKLGGKRQAQGHGKQIKEHGHTHKGGRTKKVSYAKAVAGNSRVTRSSEGGSSSIHLEPTEGTLNWLKDAWVGRLSNPTMFDKAEDELRWDYGMDTSITYLGDDMILIIRMNDERADQLMKELDQRKPPLLYSL